MRVPSEFLLAVIIPALLANFDVSWPSTSIWNAVDTTATISSLFCL
jgi:hypothetical protein